MTKKPLIIIDIKGIKCDAPDCDYHDDDVEFDPQKYLNAPCPECGENLFTEKDLIALTKMLKTDTG